MMKTNVTGVLIVHNDTSLLEPTLSTVLPYVDRLLVVDGVYEWAAPFCQMHGEDPEQSSDELLAILDKTGVPYDYHCGVWQNETHKRMFSLEKAQTNLIMGFDSDELFELDDGLLKQFYDSGKVLGECYFPLYFTDTVIGHSTGLGTPPIKPIFINKTTATVQQIVDSLFLLVPTDERSGRLGRNACFADKLGTVHHLTSFRDSLGSYRRARFYNLLAMRVAKKMSLINGGSFNTDAEFYANIAALSAEELAAFDTIFQWHRITAAFPHIKDNQTLVTAHGVKPDMQAMIGTAFTNMLQDQHQRLLGCAGQTLAIYSNRAMFFDVTLAAKSAGMALQVASASMTQLDAKIHTDFGLTRNETPAATERLTDGTWVVNIPPPVATSIRCLLELIPRSRKTITDLTYTCG